MSLKLTQTVQKGGCAAKVAAQELRSILSQVQFPPAPSHLKIGAHTFDDAAILELKTFSSDQQSLVQTLDFFTPIVDTPHWFGRIAAANALSDVYAMGGKPLSAMAILAFPLASMETSVAVQVLQGACDTLALARTPLVGGHSIDDDTLKFGLSVTGMVNNESVWSNSGARPGDVLILTKALGTGTLTAALKRQEVSEGEILPALESMAQLNDVSSYLSSGEASAIHAATDITGFGLAGHSLHIAQGSECSLQIEAGQLPLLPRALEMIEKGFLTKAHRTNREYTEKESDFGALSETFTKLILDPQTSGGLLLALKADQADSVLKKLRVGFPQSQIIGRVVPRAHRKLMWV